MEQDAEVKEQLTIDDAFAYLELGQEFNQKFRKTQNIVEKEIFACSDRPVIILCVGDLHLGSKFTNYKAIKEFIDFVKSGVYTYCIINGDIVDNFDSSSGKLQKVGLESQLVSPSEQREIYKLLINELRDEILAVNLGNHEEFSAVDTFLNATHETKIPLGLNRIVVNLKFRGYNRVGDRILQTEYPLKIAAIHKARFNSNLNPNHGNLRELQGHYPDADVILTAHTHSPAIQVRTYPQNDRLKKLIFIQTGTFKDADAHTYKYYNPYQVSDFAVQGLVVYANQRMTIPVYNLEEIKHLHLRYL